MKIAMEVAANIPTITTVPRMRRETDQNDEPNLSIDIEVVAAQPETVKRAEDRDRYREQDRKWQRPTLVQGGKDQEHKDQRQTEYPGRCSRSLPLLIREVCPVITHFRRKCLLRHFFKCSHRLTRAVAGRGRSDHLGRAINIETIGVLGTRDS